MGLEQAVEFVYHPPPPIQLSAGGITEIGFER